MGMELYGAQVDVSVLFSEPKIPQSSIQGQGNTNRLTFQCSSASRKFLNPSQTRERLCAVNVSVLFSEPKIPQLRLLRWFRQGFRGFSALQRAENSSMRRSTIPGCTAWCCFSALQRAENSSIERFCRASRRSSVVSVLFSEPKIPQCVSVRRLRRGLAVSVLFSEPKIPQSKPH